MTAISAVTILLSVDPCHLLLAVLVWLINFQRHCNSTTEL